VLSSNGAETPIKEFTEYEASAGETIIIETAGGGGFGPPSERLPAGTAADLENEYN
jgi:N-methylhydantoinase B/oxoprolinase/acetone carboxylase alpha subunit